MTNFIYIDNSLFGRITVDYDIYVTFYESIKKHKLPPLECYRGIVSPYSTLEAVGITIKNIQSIKTSHSLTQRLENEIEKKDNNEDHIYTEVMNDFTAKLYDDYFSNIKESKKFTLKNINNALIRRLDGITPEFQEYYNDHFSNHLEGEDSLNTFLSWITFDRVQGHKVKKTLETDYCCRLIVNIGQFLADDRNNSYARTVERVWHNFINNFMPESTKVRTKEELQCDVNFISDAISFHGSSDLMDIEMVNYAITGRFSDSERHPVHCFTCDNREQVITRIALSKSIIKNSVEMYSNATGKDLYSKLAHGKIIFCNTDGTIKEILCVTDEIPDLLNYIEHNSWKEWLSSN